MKVHTKVVLEWKDGKYCRVESECESYDYEGAISQCKGGGETTSVQQSDPWGGIQPYLSGNGSVPGLYAEAANLYNKPDTQYFQGETIAPLSSDTTQSQQMIGDIARQGSQGNTNLQNLYSQTMGGDFLAGGQGFDRAFQAASNRITPQVDSMFARAGRSGSGLAQTAQTQALGDAFAGLYNDERGRQTQMAAMAPMMNQMRYADASTLGQLGIQKEDYQQDLINEQIARHNFEQNAPYDKLSRYASIIQPGMGIGGTQTSTTQAPKRNRTTGALGGAAAGASVGSVVPVIGTGVGALIGGLLGAYA
jgi:hypothetical protein